MRRGDKLKKRAGPAITSMGMAMAWAAAENAERKTKEEYAREHYGQEIPRRKKSADNRDQRTGR